MGLATVGLLVTLALVGLAGCASPTPTVTPTPFPTDTPEPTPTLIPPTPWPTSTPRPTPTPTCPTPAEWVYFERIELDTGNMQDGLDGFLVQLTLAANDKKLLFVQNWRAETTGYLEAMREAARRLLQMEHPVSVENIHVQVKQLAQTTIQMAEYFANSIETLGFDVPGVGINLVDEAHNRWQAMNDAIEAHCGTATASATAIPTATPTPTLMKRIEDAVVRVEAVSTTTLDAHAGSGFIFDTEGETAFVVTAYHVIADREGDLTWIAQDIFVTDAEFDRYEARFLGGDADKDVGVVSICCNSNFRSLAWEPEPATFFQSVLAITHRSFEVGGTWSVSGEIAFPAEFDPTGSGHIWHDAPLLKGSSGSPLLTEDGTVLGINVGALASGAFSSAVPYLDVAHLIEEWRRRFVAG